MTIEQLKAGFIGCGTGLSSSDDDLAILEDEYEALDETGQAKHVYACYGLAAYWGQCLEVGITNLLMLHERASGRTATRKSIDVLFERLSRRTLGALLGELRERVEFDSEAEELLADALKKRNFLVHRFFFERAANWFAEGARREMLAELLQLVRLFRKTDTLIECIVGGLLKICGITIEQLEAEGRRLMREST